MKTDGMTIACSTFQLQMKLPPIPYIRSNGVFLLPDGFEENGDEVIQDVIICAVQGHSETADLCVDIVQISSRALFA